MEKFLFLIGFLICYISSVACPACQKQQPKILTGVTHGRGPDSNWDYVVVAATVLIVVVTLYYSIKWLVDPGENNTDHIKRTVIN